VREAVLLYALKRSATTPVLSPMIIGRLFKETPRVGLITSHSSAHTALP
jgi:hypothetical protein